MNEHTTRVKVAFVGYRYHWESYSVVRSLWEALQERPELEMLWFDKIYDWDVPVDMIFLVGAFSNSPELFGTPIIRFTFSDPNLDIKYQGKADYYFTNDLKMSMAEGYNYFPCYADKKYFKKLDLEKETDILFVGAKKHPFIPEREGIINKLKEDGFNIKCFGNGWENGWIQEEKLVEEYNKAYICLDITDEVSALGSRIFQSSMCGTPVITKRRPDIVKMFNSDLEILFYNDYQDLKRKLEFFLKNLELMFISDMGEQARERCLKDHDVSVRVNSLMEFLNDKGLL